MPLFCYDFSEHSLVVLIFKYEGKSAYNIDEAETRLSELVEKACRGEKVILMNRGEPVAMIVPFHQRRSERRLGFLKGKGRLLAGSEKTIDDFADYQ
jgi:prevent-host-death family protein